MAYVYVNGTALAPAIITEEDQIKQALYWIGFTVNAEINNIYDDSLNSYSDMQSMNDHDITDMSKDYSGRTSTNGRIHFGIRRTKRLKAYLQWVQDFYRISVTPTISGLASATFSTALTVSLERHRIRKQLRDQSDVKAKSASPGPLISEAKWIDWETKFTNYLSTLLGVNGIPLSYVIRKNDNPPAAGTTFTSFVEQTVMSAPLNGTYYEADREEVHQALVSFNDRIPF